MATGGRDRRTDSRAWSDAAAVSATKSLPGVKSGSCGSASPGFVCGSSDCMRSALGSRGRRTKAGGVLPADRSTSGFPSMMG